MARGNARELQGAAERFVLGLDPGEANVPSAEERSTATLPERVAAFEAREIHAALVKCRGNTERAATLLGLPRRTLNDKIKRFGLTP